jgi:hypothetical protein
LRLYGAEKRAEVERHIEDLKQAIEKDHAVATSPPTTPAPVSGAGGAAATVLRHRRPKRRLRRNRRWRPSLRSRVRRRRRSQRPPRRPRRFPPPAPVYAAPPAPVYAAPRPVLIAQPQQRPAPHRSVFRKAWFWFVVGAVVAAGVATTVLATRREDSDPRFYSQSGERKLSRPRIAPLTVISLLAATIANGPGCGDSTRACKSGTLFVTIELEAWPRWRPTSRIDISVGTATPKMFRQPHRSGTNIETVEIDFPAGYPTDKVVRVDVTALMSSKDVGSGSTVWTKLPAGCAAATIKIDGHAPAARRHRRRRSGTRR